MKGVGSLQQPVQVQDISINIAESNYFSQSCYIHLIYYLGNSTKVQFFQASPRKIENLISGVTNSAGVGQLFEKSKQGRLFGT